MTKHLLPGADLKAFEHAPPASAPGPTSKADSSLRNAHEPGGGVSAQGLQGSPLGVSSQYLQTYSPGLLFPLPRQLKRAELGLSEQPLPFEGVDLWTGYEVSWLNPRGKPRVAIAHFQIPCDSVALIESKSFKLYLNSFNQSRFESLSVVQEHMVRDVSAAVQGKVTLDLVPVEDYPSRGFGNFQGLCLDGLDVECSDFTPQPDLLQCGSGPESSEIIEETLITHLLKSNCLITGQPDWGSLAIRYRGRKLWHEGLLRYVVSFRNHNEFHEQCVERIFMDLWRHTQPEVLSVYARYTRRGGMEINPFRASRGAGCGWQVSAEPLRLVRQ